MRSLKKRVVALIRAITPPLKSKRRFRYAKYIARVGFVMVLSVVLIACFGSETPPTPTPEATPTSDLVATEVAVQLAAAATLSAEVPAASPTSEPPTPTNTTAAVVPTATATQPVPTATTEPAAPTATTPPDPPTATPPPVEPTPTLPIFDILPVDGDSGNQNIRGRFDDNQGRYVVVPGVPPGSLSGNPPEFREWLVFQVEPFDPAVGTSDGDGIRQVNFTIINRDKNDEEVYERTEQTPGYCVFGGGEPDCNVFAFQNNDFRWPGGPPLENADYRAVIEIVPFHSESATWNWDFALRGVPEMEETPEGEINVEIAQLGWGSLNQTVTTDLVFQVEAYHTGYGSSDGDGINFVELIIRNEQGEVVHRREERNAAYCAFSGGEPDCNRLSLDRIDSGSYTLQAVVHAVTGQTESIEATIEIP